MRSVFIAALAALAAVTTISVACARDDQKKFQGPPGLRLRQATNQASLSRRSLASLRNRNVQSLTLHAGKLWGGRTGASSATIGIDPAAAQWLWRTGPGGAGSNPTGAAFTA